MLCFTKKNFDKKNIPFPKSPNLMANFKIWNCAGLTSTALSKKKVMYFEKNFMNDFDIFFFVETHHRNLSEIPPEILGYQNSYHIIHSAASEDEKYTGIIGLISRNYDIIETKHLIQGRILNIKIRHKNEKTDFNTSAL